MSDRIPRKVPDRAQPEVDLRVLRCEPGGRLIVRTLSRMYGGLFTHWHRGRSHYCPGRESCPLHKLDKVWKGYAAVERYEQTANLWYPAVLEITEALELDLRGQWCRGQVWELTRDRPGKTGKATPVRGRLLEECDESTFPAAFDLSGVLIWIYHTPEVRLDQESPLPSRVRLAASPGPAPRGKAPEGKPGLTEQERQRFHEEIERRRKGVIDTVSGNGKHV